MSRPPSIARTSSSSQAKVALKLAVSAWIVALGVAPVGSMIASRMGTIHLGNIASRSDTATLVVLVAGAIVAFFVSAAATVIARRELKIVDASASPSRANARLAMTIGVLGMVILGGGAAVVVAFFVWLMSGHWSFG